MSDDNGEAETVQLDMVSVQKRHPGVFVQSTQYEDSEEEVVVCSMAVDDDVAEDKAAKESDDQKTDSEIQKNILDSLPCLERLRESSLERSTASGEKSDNGEVLSDRESVVSGHVTRNLRSKSHKKPQTKSTKKKPIKLGLTTRSSKGKGRRSLLKGKPVKSLSAAPTPVTSDKIYFKGEYFRKGDIVSVRDVGGGIYYAQLRGFLTDEYGDKSGVISWLCPTTGSPPPEEGFHPATYILGYEEDMPRKMEVFTFVMHAPSDYFYYRNAPYRTETRQKGDGKSGCVTLRLGPRIRVINQKAVYVGI